jgi:hypothetical protein
MMMMMYDVSSIKHQASIVVRRLHDHRHDLLLSRLELENYESDEKARKPIMGSWSDGRTDVAVGSQYLP